MFKKICLSIGAVAAVVAFLVLTFAAMIRTVVAAFSVPPPATPVTAEVIQTADWHPSLVSVGTVAAVEGVMVSAQLDGTITGIHFQPGAEVQAGDLLVQQDVGPEQAQLQAAQAALQLAKVTLKRSRELLQRNTISQAQLDSDNAAELQAEANVQNIRATIDKKTIRAPFHGRLGVRLVDLGQMLKAGDNIVSLQALNPVYVDFYLPQQNLSTLRTGLTVKVTSDAFPGETFTGQLTTINPDIDSATRNIHVEATLANPEKHLRPGMFVDVSLVLPQVEHVLAVPQTAILYAPFGDSVFVIESAKNPQTGAMAQVARQKFVRLGRSEGDFVSVEAGLSPGDQVITTGAFKLQPNMPVTVDNALAPKTELNPKPSDS